MAIPIQTWLKRRIAYFLNIAQMGITMLPGSHKVRRPQEIKDEHMEQQQDMLLLIQSLSHSRLLTEVFPYQLLAAFRHT